MLKFDLILRTCWVSELRRHASFQETAEDLYWEGEEDPANEFLEVKEEEPSAGGQFRRLKRFLFDDDDSPFNFFGKDIFL